VFLKFAFAMYFASGIQSYAAEVPEHQAAALFGPQWGAFSKSAMAITGDAKLSATTFEFDERIRFAVEYVDDFAVEYGSGVREMSLFRVIRPGPMKNGNRICYGDPTYIAVGVIREPLPGPLFANHKGMLVLVAFEGDRVPDLAYETDGCASFTYFPSRSPSFDPRRP
jgi:hypothetical protein